MAARRRPREDIEESDDEYERDAANVTVDRGSSVRRSRRGANAHNPSFSPPPDFDLGSSAGPARRDYSGTVVPTYNGSASGTASDSSARPGRRPSGSLRINMTDGPQKTLFLSGGDSLDGGSAPAQPRLLLPELTADAFASVGACAAANREMVAVVQKDLRKLLKEIAKDDWQYTTSSTKPFL
eukprot:m.312066 g.312066  ORF g.312066 m.312066 type:complete len:183 (+) comp20233_c0_seq22:78-626(+)